MFRFLQMMGQYSTRTQLVLHRYPVILRKKRTIESLLLDFSHLRSASEWSENFTKHGTESEQTRTFAFVHLSLDHETTWISSMRELHFQLVSHSEFLQNVSLSTSERYRTNSGFPRSSCSCVRPNSQYNSVQDEWLLSLTKTRTICM